MTASCASPARHIDIGRIQRDQVCVALTDHLHAVTRVGAQDAVEVGLEFLGREGHDHLLALLHLVHGDDAPARLQHGTRGQHIQLLTVLRTCMCKEINQP